jgi:5,10-methylenetetrahydrofolate reductase
MGSVPLTEARRIWLKAEAGCDFVTSQITFDHRPALDFLTSYQELCEETERSPLTVFVSLTTVPSASILSLIEGLDVVIPPRVRKRLIDSRDMGRESLKIAVEILEEIMVQAKQRKVRVPLGLQIEQVGVNNDGLSLELFDRVYPMIH